ncbi:MAG: hypothetical protein CME70_03335 [Halobacteriovorax sp.]|nr:hypothetical protein [Halobacteriovorax sp.]MBK23017.1 hypothetical protein [Halobacteriovorax sp.]|tara:strand:- start:55660 stop:56256 length:597 start_codon:yes stop_codon:yes gene_type:complete
MNKKFITSDWKFTGVVYDQKKAMHRCDLCKGKNLRYQYEIVSSLGEVKRVGSSCILKFQVKFSFPNSDFLITEQDKRKYLHRIAKRLTDRENFKLATQSLEKLIQADDKIEDDFPLKQYRKKQKLGPKFLNFLFWRFKANNIQIERNWFNLDLSTKKRKEEFYDLLDFQALGLAKCNGFQSSVMEEYIKHNKAKQENA